MISLLYYHTHDIYKASLQYEIYVCNQISYEILLTRMRDYINDTCKSPHPYDFTNVLSHTGHI